MCITKNLWLRNVCLFVLICSLITSSGCSVVMAIRQPEYKDLSVLEKKTSRTEVIAELGMPILTEEKDGRKKDVFAFKQGYGKGNKASRALFHIAADFFSCFLWEVIATPAEMIASGRNMKIEVLYDENDYVIEANILSDKKKESVKEESKEELQEKEEVKETKEANQNFGPG